MLMLFSQYNWQDELVHYADAFLSPDMCADALLSLPCPWQSLSFCTCLHHMHAWPDLTNVHAPLGRPADWSTPPRLINH